MAHREGDVVGYCSSLNPEDLSIRETDVVDYGPTSPLWNPGFTPPFSPSFPHSLQHPQLNFQHFEHPNQLAFNPLSPPGIAHNWGMMSPFQNQGDLRQLYLPAQRPIVQLAPPPLTRQRPVQEVLSSQKLAASQPVLSSQSLVLSSQNLASLQSKQEVEFGDGRSKFRTCRVCHQTISAGGPYFAQHLRKCDPLADPLREPFIPAPHVHIPSASQQASASGMPAMQLGASATPPAGYLGPIARRQAAGQCRRTDGKSWCCPREAVPGQKYCTRHIHRGRQQKDLPLQTHQQPLLLETSKQPSPASLANLPSPQAKPSSTVQGSAERKEQGAPVRGKLEGSMVPEGWCRRTDGKRWTCLQPCVPGQRYCLKHAHRGKRNRDETSLQTPANSPRDYSFSSLPNPNTPSLYEQCRRTDGRSWRCSKLAIPGQRFCEKHSRRATSSRQVAPPEDKKVTEKREFTEGQCHRTDGKSWVCPRPVAIQGGRYCTLHLHRPRVGGTAGTPLEGGGAKGLLLREPRSPLDFAESEFALAEKVKERKEEPEVDFFNWGDDEGFPRHFLIDNQQLEEPEPEPEQQESTAELEEKAVHVLNSNRLRGGGLENEEGVPRVGSFGLSSWPWSGGDFFEEQMGSRRSANRQMDELSLLAEHLEVVPKLEVEDLANGGLLKHDSLSASCAAFVN